MNTTSAIGYTRCSTAEQATSGLGMDAQRQRIEAYCVCHDLELIEIITDPGAGGAIGRVGSRSRKPPRARSSWVVRSMGTSSPTTSTG